MSASIHSNSHQSPAAIETIDVKQKGRLPLENQTSIVHSTKPSEPSRPLMEAPREMRTNGEAHRALANLEADYNQVSTTSAKIRNEIRTLEQRSPTDKKITELTVKLEQTHIEAEKLRGEIAQMRTQLSARPTLIRNESTPDLMPPPSREPIARPTVEAPVRPPLSAEAQLKADQFVNQAMEKWGAVKSSEKGATPILNQLKQVKSELADVRQAAAATKSEVDRLQLLLKDKRLAGSSRLEGVPESLIKAQEELNVTSGKVSQLEKKEVELEKQAKWAKGAGKKSVIAGRNGALSLVDRPSGPLSLLGPSKEEKAGIRMVIDQLRNTQAQGIKNFTLGNGEKVDSNSLLRLIYNSEQGRKIVDSDPSLKKAFGEIAHFDSYGQYAQDAQNIANAYSAQKGNIDKMTSRLGVAQEVAIKNHPLMQRFDSEVKPLETMKEKLAALEKFDQNEIMAFFKHLGISTGAVPKETTLIHLVNLMENPRQVYIQADANFYPINQSVNKQIDDYKAYVAFSNNITPEQRIAIIDLKAQGPSSKGLSGPKEKTEAVIKTLAKRTAALEGIPAESYQKDLNDAFSDTQNWNAGFAVLDRVASQMK